MDEILTVNHRPSTFRRLLSAFVPMLLVAVAYVDPGKWAAAVEGGARFGCDIVILMLVFNFAAILCQYLSARIAVVTGKDLAQVHISINFNIYTYICMYMYIMKSNHPA